MTEVKFNLKSVGYWELICFMWKCTICAFCAYVAIPAFVIAVVVFVLALLGVWDASSVKI